MSAKWSIIKALTCFLLVYSSTGYAQEVKTINTEPAQVFRDTIIIVKHDTIWIEKETTQIDSADISKKRSSRYDKRVHRYRKHWESLIPTHTKLHAFLGQRLTYNIPPRWRLGARAITFYYEISTCDLYIVSAFLNKYLKPKDYLSLSFGLKTQLF